MVAANGDNGFDTSADVSIIPERSKPQDYSKLEGYGDLTANERQYVEEMVTNEFLSRRDFISKYTDPRRSIDKECGYPDTASLTPTYYQNLFDRDSIANRIVEVLPKEAWQRQPKVYEKEDSDEATDFEKAWDQLGKNLLGTTDHESHFKQEEGSPVWEYLKRVDVLSGIGKFGVLLLGIDDGRKLHQPVKGFRDLKTTKDSDSSIDSQYYTVNETDPDAIIKDEEDEPEEEKKEEEVKTERKLVYMRAFPQTAVSIIRFDANDKSPRYGQPIMYNINMNDPTSGTFEGGANYKTNSVKVHWSRVIHVADNIESNEVFATPRMQPVVNRVLDLIKLYGGSAEMFWKGAFMGIAANTVDGAGRINKKALKGAMERYQNSLQRYLYGDGLKFESLAPQVSDPEKQVDVQITAICIKIACPKRVFMGSERGELASGQDDSTWNDRLKERQSSYITPRIIVPFVNRCIAIGVLPIPQEGFRVNWPNLFVPSAAQQAERAAKLTQALSAYISGGCEAGMDPMSYYTIVWGLEEEEAEAIVEATESWLKKNNPDAENVHAGAAPEPPADELQFNPADGQPIDQKKFGKPVPGKTKFPPKAPPKPTRNARRLLTNALGSGANCGTGSGGFRPGNVCAKGKAVIGSMMKMQVGKSKLSAKEYAEKRQPRLYAKNPHLKPKKLQEEQARRAERFKAVQQGRVKRSVKRLAEQEAHKLQSMGERVTQKDIAKVYKKLVDEAIYGKMPKGAKGQERIEVTGVQGRQNKPFSLSFRNKERFERWKANNHPTIHSVKEYKSAAAKQSVARRIGRVATMPLKFAAGLGVLYAGSVIAAGVNEAAKQTVEHIFRGRPTTNSKEKKRSKAYRTYVDALTKLMLAEFPPDVDDTDDERTTG